MYICTKRETERERDTERERETEHREIDQLEANCIPKHAKSGQRQLKIVQRAAHESPRAPQSKPKE